MTSRPRSAPPHPPSWAARWQASRGTAPRELDLDASPVRSSGRVGEQPRPAGADGCGRRCVSTWFATWLRLVGSADPGRDTHAVGNYITGLVLHQLAIPDPQFDPADKIIPLLESLTGTRPTPAPGGTAGPQGGAAAGLTS